MKGKKKPKYNQAPLVAVIMGSDSDYKVMKEAIEALKNFKIPYEAKVISAHRTPKEMVSFASTAREDGIRVIIAGAGGAAHLPGMVAAVTDLPVIGVPVPVGALQGDDALLSIVQMPKGVPVATMAIGGAFNAGILAAQILSASVDFDISNEVLQKLRNYKSGLRKAVLAKVLPND